MKLAMLQQRIAPMRQNVAPPAHVERLRGRAWMRLRDAVLRRDFGLCCCEDCALLVVPLPASEVDHIVELTDGGTDSMSNLRSMNVDCHLRKTNAARKARGQVA